jgi:hypothetical protein
VPPPSSPSPTWAPPAPTLLLVSTMLCPPKSTSLESGAGDIAGAQPTDGRSELPRYNSYHPEIILFEFRNEDKRSKKSHMRQMAQHTHILGRQPQVGSVKGLLGRGLHSLKTQRGVPRCHGHDGRGGCRTQWGLQNLEKVGQLH